MTSASAPPSSAPGTSSGRRVGPKRVGPGERAASLVLGLAAIFLVRDRSGPMAWATRAVGSALVARGWSGSAQPPTVSREPSLQRDRSR